MITLTQNGEILARKKRIKEIAEFIMDSPLIYDSWVQGEIEVNENDKMRINEYIKFIKIQRGASVTTM